MKQRRTATPVLQKEGRETEREQTMTSTLPATKLFVCAKLFLFGPDLPSVVDVELLG